MREIQKYRLPILTNAPKRFRDSSKPHFVLIGEHLSCDKQCGISAANPSPRLFHHVCAAESPSPRLFTHVCAAESPSPRLYHHVCAAASTSPATLGHGATREMVGAAPVCPPERPRSGVSIHKGHVPIRKGGVFIRKGHVPHP